MFRHRHKRKLLQSREGADLAQDSFPPMQTELTAATGISKRPRTLRTHYRRGLETWTTTRTKQTCRARLMCLSEVSLPASVLPSWRAHTCFPSLWARNECCLLVSTEPSSYGCHTKQHLLPVGIVSWIGLLLKEHLDVDRHISARLASRCDFGGKHLKVRTPSLVTRPTRASVSHLVITEKGRMCGPQARTKGDSLFSQVSLVSSSSVLSHRGFPSEGHLYFSDTLRFVSISSSGTVVRFEARQEGRKHQKTPVALRRWEDTVFALHVFSSFCDGSAVSEINKMSVEKRLKIGNRVTFCSMTERTCCHAGDFIQASLKPSELWNSRRRQKRLRSPTHHFTSMARTHQWFKSYFIVYRHCISFRLPHDHMIRTEKKIDDSYFVTVNVDRVGVVFVRYCGDVDTWSAWSWVASWLRECSRKTVTVRLWWGLN